MRRPDQVIRRHDVRWAAVVFSWVSLAFGCVPSDAAELYAKAPSQSLPAVTRRLLKDMETYCYACHHGERGKSFDKFSRQPAFFAADSESELIQNIRGIASRAVRYLRSKRMPKVTDPLLPMTKRREMVIAIKALAITPPAEHIPITSLAQLNHIRRTYDQHILPIIKQKCNVCHGQEANRFQKMLFGGTIRLAKREWDSSAGYPFGGDYAQDPILLLSMLEVTVVNRSMPPLAYTSTLPSKRLSKNEVNRILNWIEGTRAVYNTNDVLPAIRSRPITQDHKQRK